MARYGIIRGVRTKVLPQNKHRAIFEALKRDILDGKCGAAAEVYLDLPKPKVNKKERKVKL